VAEARAARDAAIGARVGVRLDPAKVFVFDRDGARLRAA
jgi:hypothetical protein